MAYVGQVRRLVDDLQPLWKLWMAEDVRGVGGRGVTNEKPGMSPDALAIAVVLAALVLFVLVLLWLWLT